MLPDLDLTREVLAHMHGLDDLRLWLLDLSSRLRKPPKGWGFYLHDAQNWPSRRADVQGQVDAQRAVMEAEAKVAAEAFAAASAESEAALRELEREQQAQQEFIEAATAKGWPIVQPNSRCRNCRGIGRRDLETGAFCECEAGRTLVHRLEHCARCSNTGLVPAPGNPHESAWCECVHGDRKRVSNPSLVEDANRVARDLGLIAAAPKPAEPAPTREPSAIREPARHVPRRHGARMVRVIR